MPDEQPTSYHHLARLLREQIAAGQPAPGQRIPTESFLMQWHGLARETVRRAVHELRKQGLLDYVRGNGYVVRVQPEREDLRLEEGDVLISRMPTPEERDELGLGAASRCSTSCGPAAPVTCTPPIGP